MPYTEVLIGAGAGVLLFLGWEGYNVLPVLFIITAVYMIWYMGGMKAHKSFVVTPNTKNKQTLIDFNDIGGQEVAKNELKEALDFIRDKETIKHLGIRPLKGILLNGPPGTGKTLLAKAAAQYTHSAFVGASGSEFVEMYVGVGAKRVRQLFETAKSLAKAENLKSAVVFIDEMEIIGGKRGQNTSNVEYDQTLNELLVQMDGISFDDEISILVIGATNRIDMLDSALLRPGRFDRQVRVDLPDKNGRLHILKLHVKNKPLAEDVDLSEVAKDTFGFSGAQLESLTNEAAILAMREGLNQISATQMKSAIDKVIMGEKLDRRPCREEKQRIAIHEAGHALISEIVQPGSVASVNVASRSSALGYVRQTQDEERFLYTEDYMRNKIAVALAGAVAEENLLGKKSTGSSNDFEQAVKYCKQIIFSGMSELGIISPDDLPKDVMYSEITKIMQQEEKRVKDLLTHYKDILGLAAVILVDNETLSGEEFRNMLEDAAA